MTAMTSGIHIPDTHANIKELISAGMDESVAEVVVRQSLRVLEETVVTKTDLANFRTEVNTSFTELRAEMNVRFEKVDSSFKTIDSSFEKVEERSKALEARMQTLVTDAKNDTRRWMIGTNIALAAFIITTLKIL